MNGLVWASGNDGCGSGQVCARFIEAQAATTSAQVMPGQDWDVGAGSEYVYSPSVTFDGAGDMVVSVSQSSSATEPAVDVVAQVAGYSPGPSFVTQAQQGSVAYTYSSYRGTPPATGSGGTSPAPSPSIPATRPDRPRAG